MVYRVHTQSTPEFDREAHHALARQCAGEAVVLLENDGILPLAPQTRVALIGDFAQTPRYQGAGSSRVNPTRVDTLLEAAEKALCLTGFARGYDAASQTPDAALIAEAAALAKRSEAVLLCIGLDDRTEAEGFDRDSLALPPSHTALLEALQKENPNIILVLSGGAPFLMPPKPWRAAIHGYLGGQAGAGAMADCLTGQRNPGGKLAESWPLKLVDTPCHSWYPGTGRTAEYREGLYVGYRYYESAGVPTRYCFGHGLSYTDFAYSGLEVSREQVRFTLTNTGSRTGSEIAQVYLAPDCANRPARELKGFAKITLAPGESKTVTVPLDDKAFRYYDREKDRWETLSGTHTLLVGASVRDIRLRGTITIADGSQPRQGFAAGQLPHIGDDVFAQQLGRAIPPAEFSLPFGKNDTVAQLIHSPSALARLFSRKIADMAKKDPTKLDLMMIYQMPLRAIANFSGGHLTQKMADDLTRLANGQTLRALGCLLRDYLRSRQEIRRFLALLPKETTQKQEDAK